MHSSFVKRDRKALAPEIKEALLWTPRVPCVTAPQVAHRQCVFCYSTPRPASLRKEPHMTPFYCFHGLGGSANAQICQKWSTIWIKHFHPVYGLAKELREKVLHRSCHLYTSFCCVCQFANYTTARVPAVLTAWETLLSRHCAARSCEKASGDRCTFGRREASFIFCFRFSVYDTKRED